MLNVIDRARKLITLNHMVERSSHTDDVLIALAHPVRRELLRRVLGADATVSQLAEGQPMSLAAVSKHLRVLERAGLLRRERRGREFHFTAIREPLDRVEKLLFELRAHWTDALDRLAELAENEPSISEKENEDK